MDLPTIEMVGPPGPVVINASDEGKYRAMGYKMATEIDPVEGDGGEPDSMPVVVDPTAVEPVAVEPVTDMESDAMPPGFGIDATPQPAD